MTPPRASHLGRSVVVAADQPTPELWVGADSDVVDRRLLDDSVPLEKTVNELQRRDVDRIPTVLVLDVDPEELNQAETADAPPYELGSEFTFLRERLTKLIWHNSYDARSGELIWWWAHKAAARLDVDGLVVHHESIELGKLTPVPKPNAPDADLAPDQLDAVSHLVGPARVIAPAGSGKTRVLTERVRHLIEDRDVEADLVTALAYNRRAAREMVERLPEGERLNVRTIHVGGGGDPDHEGNGDFHVCAIVEFEDGKIKRETRHYVKASR